MSIIQKEFFTEYLDHFNLGNSNLLQGGECSGDLLITAPFILSCIHEPRQFGLNLARIGLTCDCRFIQALPGLMLLKSPFSWDKLEKRADKYEITWDLSPFRQTIESLKNGHIGLRIRGMGYFPPHALKEMSINMMNVDQDGHAAIIIVDRGSFLKDGFKDMEEN